MWVIIGLLFLLMFVVEEKVKHRFWQPVLFLIITFIVALILTHQPHWMENLI